MSKEAKNHHLTDDQNPDQNPEQNPEQYPDLSQKEFHELSIPILDVASSITKVKDILDKFLDNIENSLNHTRRLRLNGIGIRRYGFTDKVSDMAAVALAMMLVGPPERVGSSKMMLPLPPAALLTAQGNS